MGLWWFCFVQWPLLILLDRAKNKHLFSCLAESFVCQLETYFGAYMMYLAPYLLLPLVLTIILAIRKQRGQSISKLEKWLAIGSWVLSLLVSAVVGLQGGFRT